MIYKIRCLIAFVIGVIIFSYEQKISEREEFIFLGAIIGLVLIILGGYFKLIRCPFCNKKVSLSKNYCFSIFYLLGIALSSFRIIFTIYSIIIFHTLFFIGNERRVDSENKSEEEIDMIVVRNSLSEVLTIFILYILIGMANFF